MTWDFCTNLILMISCSHHLDTHEKDGRKMKIQTLKVFFRVLLTTHQRQTRVQIFYGISSFASLPIPGVYKYIKLPTQSYWTVQGYSGDGMLKEGSEWSKEIPRAKLLTNISTDDLWGVKTFQHITHDSLVWSPWSLSPASNGQSVMSGASGSWQHNLCECLASHF